MNRLRTWEELDISDNFIFQKVMQDEKLCKDFIEKLLGINVKSVKYPESENVVTNKMDWNWEMKRLRYF